MVKITKMGYLTKAPYRLIIMITGKCNHDLIVYANITIRFHETKFRKEILLNSLGKKFLNFS